ncbi:MAG TPA: hypothetical protein ENK48_00930 [Gammaproteobacteria bacterium]|nr:hypothetical protein [Gammaproteobacteria bacterium]
MCHTTRGWLPLIYRHTTANYPGDHRGNFACVRCHTSNSEVIPWRYAAYKPDCAGCHAGDYKPGEHKNASVSSLRNCSGSCHKPGPKHRVSDRDWD